jgi:predicted heme/steroid binding protein
MDSPTPRRRVRASSSEVPATSHSAEAEDRKQKTKSESNLNVVDILRGIVGLLVLSAAMSWFITGDSVIWNWRQVPTVIGAAKRWFVRTLFIALLAFLHLLTLYQGGPISLTDAQLALYNGTDPRLPIYVGLNGSIYDVSASAHTYGPGGSYSFFAGRDAARGFITGCFQEDMTPDLRGVEEMYMPIDTPEKDKALTKKELKLRRERELRVAKKRVAEGIQHWVEVFKGETGRPYFYAGTIKREKGWLEKLPKRELCQAAVEARPNREDSADTEKS